MRLVIISILFIFSILSYGQEDKTFSYVWNEHRNTLKDSTVVMGPAVFKKTSVTYRRNRKELLSINFDSPVQVYQAKKAQPWGFVQFPSIFKTIDGRLAVTWRLNPDRPGVTFKSGWKYSKDQGNTWTYKWADRPINPGTKLPDGDYFKFLSGYKSDTIIPSNKKPFAVINDYANTSYIFYDFDIKPKELLTRDALRYDSSLNQFIKAKVPFEDNETAVYKIDDKISVLSWGPMVLHPSGTIIKATYPGFIKYDNECVTGAAIMFYQSSDNGDTWSYQGSIRPPDLDSELSLGLTAYSEPSLEVLEDGSLLSVFRTSLGVENAPMYISRSYDMGKTWTKPRPVTNNGVLPQLLRLGNGVLVLTSGRPGVQVRFNIEGDAVTWTDSFEMVRFKGLQGQASCGYTGMIPLSHNSFLLVYSDFKNRDKENITRKTILTRKITVDKL